MKKILSPIDTWRHEEVWSCLQTSIAGVLTYYGADAVTILGAGWDFYYLPGDVRWQEYYYPCRWPSLGRSLGPHHPIVSRWHHPADAESGWLEVKAAIDRGIPPIVAVDNFHLTYRPAYQDVHADHLVVVYGYDEEADEVYVLDGSPPGRHGPVPGEEMRRARASSNPVEGERDLFFAGTQIDHRWLEVELEDELPAVTREWVVKVMADNVERFRRREEGPGLSGMKGMEEFFAAARERLAQGEGIRVMDELYIFGYAIQASTVLHGEFLTRTGRRLGWTELVELGRRVGRLGHHWTPLRVMGAHGRSDPPAMAPRVERRARCLLSDQMQVLAEMEDLLHLAGYPTRRPGERHERRGGHK